MAAFLLCQQEGDQRRLPRLQARWQGIQRPSVRQPRDRRICARRSSRNTVENYFSILKRGITGVYHHVSQEHLKRYLGEFDFRYNERSALGVSDKERTEKMLSGIVGKRLTYRRTNRQEV
jgi:hypothetical protein